METRPQALLAELTRLQLEGSAEWVLLLQPKLVEREGQPVCFLQCLCCGDLLDASVDVTKVYAVHMHACSALRRLANSAGIKLATLLHSAEGQRTFGLNIQDMRLKQGLAACTGASLQPLAGYRTLTADRVHPWLCGSSHKQLVGIVQPLNVTEVATRCSGWDSLLCVIIIPYHVFILF